MRSARGFTLIELISVIVLLGIMGSMGVQFIVSTMDSYRKAQINNRLLLKGRFSIEQMTRYLRASAPNSVRVSSSGNCFELLPTVGGAFYEGQVADAENGAASTSSVTTSAFELDLGAAEHALIGGLTSDEIYTAAVPSARIEIASLSGSPINTVIFTLPHTFNRNSINNRIFIADDPIRFCLNGSQLIVYENYGLLTSAMNDIDPGGDSAILASDVSADGTAFSLSAGSEDRNSALNISLVFSEANRRVPMKQTVLVRNVP